MHDECILIIDDDPSVRFFVEEALRRTGYAVVGVATAEEALDQLATSPPGLIVIDLQLTGMTGMKLLERLRDAGRDIPSLILTAHGVPLNARRALALGAVDFLPKPCTTAELRQAVAMALDPTTAARHREAFLDLLLKNPEQSVDRVRDAAGGNR